MERNDFQRILSLTDTIHDYKCSTRGDLTDEQEKNKILLHERLMDDIIIAIQNQDTDNARNKMLSAKRPQRGGNERLSYQDKKDIIIYNLKKKMKTKLVIDLTVLRSQVFGHNNTVELPPRSHRLHPKPIQGRV